MAADAAGRRGPAFAFPLSWAKAALPVLEPIGKAFKSDLVTEASLGAVEASPIVDGSKARDELGYQPRSAQETLRDLIAFYVTTGGLGRKRT
jgi:dihydroflavonol-4-reductase